MIRDATAADIPRIVDFVERDAPLRYYSRERLFSLAARTMFIEPAPLPSL